MAQTTTAWYPVEVKPTRQGVYQVNCPLLCDMFFSYWDGAGWGYFVNPLGRADELRGTRENLAGALRGMTWRGVIAP